MKKMLIVAAALLSAGCASDESCGVRKTVIAETPVVEETKPAPVVEEKPSCGCPEVAVQPQPAPCAQAKPEPCPCAAPKPCACARPAPCREIQRPRITETVAPKPRRKCPTDGQTINCGCGNYKTFEQPKQAPVYETSSYSYVPVVTYTPTEQARPYYQAPTYEAPAPRTYVPAMPEAYVLASNRVVSRLLKDASSIYSQNPSVKLYVKPARLMSSDLPGGIEKGVANFKNQIASSYTFAITENPSEADYTVETTANWFDTPSKSVPAIQYTTTLIDRNQNKVKEWAEIIKKASNTQSWL